MATDEAMALAFSEGRAPPTLRLYAWSEPTVSIGAFQKLEARWQGPLEANKLPLIRRITGGRALLHASEVTYAVVAGTRDPLFSAGIKGTYLTLSKGLLQALKILGVQAELCRSPREKHRRRFKSPLCFSTASWYELTHGGNKLVGSAQRRWPNCFLQHGSLMLEKDLPGPRQSPLQEFVSEQQVALSELLPRAPSRDRCIEAFKSGFASVLGLRLAPGRISTYEQEIIQALVSKKYGRRDWNRFRKKEGSES